MVFVEFTLPYGRTVWIDVYEIVIIEEKTLTSTMVTVKNGKPLEVAENIDDIVAKIKLCKSCKIKIYVPGRSGHDEEG